MCIAVPGKILTISGDEPLTRTARVDFGGVEREVNLACLPRAEVNDWVLVHVGFAISTIDELEARKVFEDLKAISEIEQAGR